MKLYKIKSKNDGIFLDDVQEYEISKIISDIVKDISLEVFAYNICHDHIHILIACNPSDLSNIIWKLKWQSTKIYKDKHNIEDKIHLWWQKFNSEIVTNKQQLINTIKYIKDNRIKHKLSDNKYLKKIDFCIKIKYD